MFEKYPQEGFIAHSNALQLISGEFGNYSAFWVSSMAHFAFGMQNICHSKSTWICVFEIITSSKRYIEA